MHAGRDTRRRLFVVAEHEGPAAIAASTFLIHKIVNIPISSIGPSNFLLELRLIGHITPLHAFRLDRGSQATILLIKIKSPSNTAAS